MIIEPLPTNTGYTPGRLALHKTGGGYPVGNMQCIHMEYKKYILNTKPQDDQDKDTPHQKIVNNINLDGFLAKIS